MAGTNTMVTSTDVLQLGGTHTRPDLVVDDVSEVQSHTGQTGAREDFV